MKSDPRHLYRIMAEGARFSRAVFLWTFTNLEPHQNFYICHQFFMSREKRRLVRRGAAREATGHEKKGTYRWIGAKPRRTRRTQRTSLKNFSPISSRE